MRMASLEAYDVPFTLIRLWEKTYGASLLPVQEAAVTRHGVLAGRNLIVQAPTSAGKTFIAEMAAVRAALTGRKVLYLVPTKALAEDKFAQFEALYGSLGLRLLITTRDRRNDDSRFVTGDFDLAIAIPEKVRALWTKGGVSQFLGLAVVDELQILSDPDRGPCLELILAELRQLSLQASPPKLQIIGLSASLGASPMLAEYLGAEWLESDERPVKLRKGILLGDRFFYIDSDGQRGEEYFPNFHPPSESNLSELTLRLAVYFAEHREPTILFVRDRASAVQLAMAIAERLADGMLPRDFSEDIDLSMNIDISSKADGGGEPSADAEVPALTERLAALDRTTVRERLQRLATVGVGFHSADLQFEDRRVVEEAFATGELRVLCATPTLALGVNLPAQNVIIDPWGWRTERADAPSALSPISRADFENRAGRAGRLGYGDFGRAILIAENEAAAEMLRARYLEAPFASPTPALLTLPPEQMTLVLAAGAAMRRITIDEAYAHTFSAYAHRHASLPKSAQAGLDRALKAGLLRQEGTRLIPSSLGQKAAAAGVSFATSLWLMEWASRAEPTQLEAMFIAAMTREAQEIVPFLGTATRGHIEALACQAAAADQEGALLCALLTEQRYEWRQREHAAWLVLILRAWLAEKDMYAFEQQARVPTARLELLAETMAWLIETLADLGAEKGWRAQAAERLRSYAATLTRPLSSKRSAKTPGKHSSNNIAQPMASGANTSAGCLATPPMPSLPLATSAAPDSERPSDNASSGFDASPVLCPRQVTDPKPLALQSGAHQNSPAPAQDARGDDTDQPILILRKDRPDHVIFFGQPVTLRRAEFRLLYALAENAGRCVSYEALYDHMWQEPLAEPGQIYVHRHRLCAALQAATPPDQNIRSIMRTIRGQGLLLDLPPKAIHIA